MLALPDSGRWRQLFPDSRCLEWRCGGFPPKNRSGMRPTLNCMRPLTHSFVLINFVWSNFKHYKSCKDCTGSSDTRFINLPLKITTSKRQYICQESNNSMSPRTESRFGVHPPVSVLGPSPGSHITFRTVSIIHSMNLSPLGPPRRGDQLLMTHV